MHISYNYSCFALEGDHRKHTCAFLQDNAALGSPARSQPAVRCHSAGAVPVAVLGGPTLRGPAFQTTSAFSPSSNRTDGRASASGPVPRPAPLVLRRETTSTRSRLAPPLPVEEPVV